MNIVSAIRNLPEPPQRKGSKWRWLLGFLGLAGGLLLIFAGVTEKDVVVLGLGVSLTIFSLVPLARSAGVPDRTARTAGGLALVGWFVLPTEVTEWLLGDLRMNFSIFILAGLAIVVGATWTSSVAASRSGRRPPRRAR
ncbi:MAG: hypothetical protein WD805_04735 [Gaiellaceae bacterium]